jgi:hypothetical protein
MRKLVGAILLFTLAATVASFGREETLEQLIARADAARPDRQPELYMQVAQRELKMATEAFKTDKMDDFHAAVEQIVKYSDSAHSAALHSVSALSPRKLRFGNCDPIAGHQAQR